MSNKKKLINFFTKFYILIKIIIISMSRTIKNTKFWFRHAPKWHRKAMNHQFRSKEKQYFIKFKETLKKSKDRGYTYW